MIGKLDAAVRTVRAREPFPGYLDSTEVPARFVATTLLALRPPPARLLDLGCGPLDKTAVFQALGYECYACDDFRDPWHRRGENLDRIKAFAEYMRIHLHVQDIQDRAITLPWAAESFDVATVLDVIEHLHASPRELLNTVGASLAPGGVVVVTSPNAVNLRKRLAVLFGHSNYPPLDEFLESVGPWRGHVREFTLDEVIRTLRWMDFQIVDGGLFVGGTAHRQSAPVQWAYRLLAGLVPTLRDQIFVAARKPAVWHPRAADVETARVLARHAVPAAVG